MSEAVEHLNKRMTSSGRFAIAPAALWYQMITAKSSGQVVDLSGAVRFFGWTSTPVLWLLTIPTSVIGAGMAVGSLAALPVEAGIETYHRLTEEQTTHENQESEKMSNATDAIELVDLASEEATPTMTRSDSFTLLGALLKNNKEAIKQKRVNAPLNEESVLKEQRLAM